MVKPHLLLGRYRRRDIVFLPAYARDEHVPDRYFGRRRRALRGRSLGVRDRRDQPGTTGPARRPPAASPARTGASPDSASPRRHATHSAARQPSPQPSPWNRCSTTDVRGCHPSIGWPALRTCSATYFAGGVQLAFSAPAAPMFGTFDLPLAGGTRRLKVGENNSALVQDRIELLYNHYHNALNEDASGFVGDPAQRIAVGRPLHARHGKGLGHGLLVGRVAHAFGGRNELHDRRRGHRRRGRRQPGGHSETDRVPVRLHGGVGWPGHRHAHRQRRARTRVCHRFHGPQPGGLPRSVRRLSATADRSFLLSGLRRSRRPDQRESH